MLAWLTSDQVNVDRLHFAIFYVIIFSTASGLQLLAIMEIT